MLLPGGNTTSCPHTVEEKPVRPDEAEPELSSGSSCLRSDVSWSFQGDQPPLTELRGSERSQRTDGGGRAPAWRRRGEEQSPAQQVEQESWPEGAAPEAWRRRTAQERRGEGKIWSGSSPQRADVDRAGPDVGLWFLYLICSHFLPVFPVFPLPPPPPLPAVCWSLWSTSPILSRSPRAPSSTGLSRRTGPSGAPAAAAQQPRRLLPPAGPSDRALRAGGREPPWRGLLKVRAELVKVRL